MPTTKEKNKSSRKNEVKAGVHLSLHDINAIALVAQNPNVERSRLVKLLKEQSVSSNALDIVSIILDRKPSNVQKHNALTASRRVSDLNAKKTIAKNYMDWAAELGSPKKS